jgi:hypothetical protein
VVIVPHCNNAGDILRLALMGQFLVSAAGNKSTAYLRPLPFAWFCSCSASLSHCVSAKYLNVPCESVPERAG